MNIIKAIQLAHKYNNIRRSGWPEKHCIGIDFKRDSCTNRRLIWKFGSSKNDNPYIISSYDVLALDWEICQKLHTFEEALRALKNDKIIKQSSEKFIDYYMNGDKIFKRYDGEIMEIFCFSNKFILAEDWMIFNKPKIGTVTGNKI